MMISLAYITESSNEDEPIFYKRLKPANIQISMFFSSILSSILGRKQSKDCVKVSSMKARDLTQKSNVGNIGDTIRLC